MLFLLQSVFRCPEKGLLGDVYSPPDNDRSHDVQVSQVQEKTDLQNPKNEEKIKKTLIFQLDDPLPPDRNVGPNRPRLRRPPARVGQDVPVHTLSQISLPRWPRYSGIRALTNIIAIHFFQAGKCTAQCTLNLYIVCV